MEIQNWATDLLNVPWLPWDDSKTWTWTSFLSVVFLPPSHTSVFWRKCPYEWLDSHNPSCSVTRLLTDYKFPFLENKMWITSEQKEKKKKTCKGLLLIWGKYPLMGGRGSFFKDTLNHFKFHKVQWGLKEACRNTGTCKQNVVPYGFWKTIFQL